MEEDSVAKLMLITVTKLITAKHILVAYHHHVDLKI